MGILTSKMVYGENKQMDNMRKLDQGFTLLELMIAMFLSITVVSGIFALFRNQVAIHNTERLMVSMQQNLRAAVSFMERDIRLAGSDPSGTAGAGVLTANRALIQFLSDTDEDGVLDDDENITYSLDNDADGDGIADGTPCNLVRTITNLADVTLSSDIVARNIDALNLDYYDSSGNLISDKTVNPWVAPANQVARVEVSIVARSGNTIPGLFIRRRDTKVYRNQSGDQILGAQNDFFRRMQVTTDIDCRNVAN